MIKQFKIISLIICLVCILFVFIGCQKQEEKTSYNGREYDLSTNGDKSIIAKTEKVGTKYTLTISGSGEGIDFDRKEGVPWNPIIKSIDKVVIKDGVTKIGSYYFYSSRVDEFYLPASLKTISSNAFNESQMLYSYGEEIKTYGEFNLYYFSETPPSVYGKYFHIVNGTAVVWNKNKVLFVGNSFTYYTFTPDNPLVPKLFKEIAESLGESVEVDFVIKGSHTLTGFSNPNDEMGKILYEKLNSNDDYTYVILQEQSTAPLNSYENFKKAVGTIKDLVDRTQKNCKVVLYETWGSPTGIASTGHKTVSDMEMALRSAYERCASEYNIQVSYVGKAFSYAYEVKNVNVYFTDNRHQNEIGSYLSSCVHLASILKVDVRNTSFNYNLDSDVANLMKDIAFKIAFGIDLEEATSQVNNNEDNTNHLLVIAWYDKTQTSGLNEEIINNFQKKLKEYLSSLNYSDEEINSVLLRAYSGNVGPSCENIKNDGDVDIMFGWKSNVSSTGNLSYLESFPSDANSSGITMGDVSDRWIHRLSENELAKMVFNWIISEKDNSLFQ